jgi:mRNA-degrading endonuclease RelE of RelBE toxin-antitoxin system
MYEVRFAVGVADDLRSVRASERRRILEEVQRKLVHEPTRPTKHIKRLERLLLPFEHMPPIWQLRIGDYRVFYDVGDAKRLVIVRAVRRKPAHMTTEQIL